MSWANSKSLFIATCMVSWGVATSTLSAQEEAATTAVRAAGAAYVKALRRGKASEIEEFWTDDGVYIDADGARFPARDLARQEFTEAAASADDDALSAIDSMIDFVGPDVAIEQSRGLEPHNAVAPTSAPPQFIAAWVKQNDRWRLSMLRELPAASVEAPTASTPHPLKELDWMVGRWAAKQGDAVIELTAKKSGAYLVQKFIARRDGKVVRRGTQRIAWDAAAARPRSWTLNADGGFSEATWRQDGNVWVAESTGVQADGSRTKCVQFWTAEGEDARWFKSLHGEVDGQPVEDLILKFTRTGQPSAAPTPAAPANDSP